MITRRRLVQITTAGIIGGGWTHGSGFADGHTGAPSGVIQLPTMLNASSATNGLGRNLATRPPWQVAGVDYYVGIDRAIYPTNANLKDASSASLPSGCSRNGVIITVSGSGDIVLDGYDFSVTGGMTINWQGSGTLTITNSFFKVGSTNNCGITSVNSPVGLITVKNCEFDGNGIFCDANFGTNSASPMAVYAHCPLTMQWCYLHDAWEDGIKFDPQGANLYQLIIQYCLFDTNSFNTNAHSDWMQTNPDMTAAVQNAILEFCTFHQTLRGGNNAQSGFRLNVQVKNPNCSYNVYTVNSDAQCNAELDIVEGASDSPASITNAQVINNYLMADLFGHPAITCSSSYGGGITNANVFNNYDLVTGAVITDSGGHNPWQIFT